MKMIRKMISVCLVLSMLMGVGLLQAVAENAGMLKPGDTGEAVLVLQERLYELGYTQTELDGVYGAGTESAVIAFQLRNSLLASGIADQTTQAF